MPVGVGSSPKSCTIRIAFQLLHRWSSKWRPRSTYWEIVKHSVTSGPTNSTSSGVELISTLGQIFKRIYKVMQKLNELKLERMSSIHNLHSLSLKGINAVSGSHTLPKWSWSICHGQWRSITQNRHHFWVCRYNGFWCHTSLLLWGWQAKIIEKYLHFERNLAICGQGTGVLLLRN